MSLHVKTQTAHLKRPQQAWSQTTPIGGSQNFRGGAKVTGKRTQLTIAIKCGVTTLRMGVQNNAANGASRKVLRLYSTCNILGAH